MLGQFKKGVKMTTANKIKRCEYYPSSKENTCVCDAGSDVSGAGDNFCTIEYSKNCQWARQIKEKK